MENPWDLLAAELQLSMLCAVSKDGSPSERVKGIVKGCAETAALLLYKNQKYGDSVFEPVQIFSKLEAIDGARVRIDDKLSRIRTSPDAADEDTVQDLIGYLVLYRLMVEDEDRMSKKMYPCVTDTLVCKAPDHDLPVASTENWEEAAKLRAIESINTVATNLCQTAASLSAMCYDSKE